MLTILAALVIQTAPPGDTDRIRALIEQATAEREAGRVDAALAAADAAIVAARRLSPGDPILLSDALVARCDAESQTANGDDRDCREAMAIRRPLLGDADPRVLNLDIQLAITDVMAGRVDLAEPVVRRSVRGLKALPETAALNTDVGMGVAVLGMVEEASLRPAEAEANYREALTILEKADALGLRYRPIVYNYLNGLLLGQGRTVEAAVTSRIALDIQRQLAPVGDPQTIGALIRLGLVQQRAGRLDEAAASAREALDLLDAQQQAPVAYRYQALLVLGGVQVDLGRADLALPLFEQAEAVALSLPDGAERRAAPVRLRIAALRLDAGDPEGALEAALSAMPGALQDRSGTEGQATALTHVAVARERIGDTAGARDAASQALALREASSPDAPAMSAPLTILARLALAEGDGETARRLLDRAVTAGRNDSPLSPARLDVRNARVKLALTAPEQTEAERTLANETAADAAELILVNARSGVRAEGVADITRTALGSAIEMRWRASAQE